MKTDLRFLLLVLLFSSIFHNSFTQSPRLIIRGDDMGFSHSANEALIHCYQEGIMTTVEVMPVTPWFPEAVKLCNENPDLDVGIHLALTSEWSNLKWRPLTYAPSLTNEDGFFHSMIWPNKNYGEDQALKGNNWKLKEIEKEVRAQIELSIKHIPHISHVSTHMGWANIDPEVSELVKQLAEEYGIHIDLEKYDVQSVRYVGPKDTDEEKRESFIKMLRSLKKGKTYMFVEHPGFDNPELQAIHHIGYENVATDRNGVTKIWTDPEIKTEINKLGIELINYKDIKD